MWRLIMGKPREEAKVETQRETFERLTKELGELMATMPIKPIVTIDPNTGIVSFEAPEQFQDEALSLPAPEKDEADADGKEAA